MSVMTPYHSELRVRRDGFAQLLRAEWTKFRTVRGWLIGMAVAMLLIVGLGALTGANSECGIQLGPNSPSTGLPGAAHRAGRGVGDRQLLLRPPAAGRERQHHCPGHVADRPVLHPAAGSRPTRTRRRA